MWAAATAVCECILVTDDNGHDPLANTQTHIYTHTQASEIPLALVTFWIHKSVSLRCKSMLVNLMN